MQLSEIWGDSHWADAHIQLPEWSDYRADFALLNGRVYPDTMAPNATIIPAASTHSFVTETDAKWRSDRARRADPTFSTSRSPRLVTCNAGERVLLRFANLGFRESAMTLAGIKMKSRSARTRRR